ncbi:response regulator [Zooshikella marina]|uniref:sensor histidine kinase n=1 Tax=Zooshikella ganghwensis TaxID=202772 RepID=UPI001BAF5D2E|nr:ATP-binding protein [Zooshikella ganghwensis]MBU2708199.1 response regulator [Zooshikella ganghwensis]
MTVSIKKGEFSAKTSYRASGAYQLETNLQERPNILIVDDRPENLVATRKTLKTLDVNILEASSGNEALSLMLRYRFAVVLLDVQMPGMDGFETATLMQEDKQMRQTPIIFVTAISKEESYANRAAEIGAVDYIFKPINPCILTSKVKVYVELYQQHRRVQQLNDFLQYNNEELERFAYIVSHDLKEPARNVLNFATLYRQMKKDKNKSPEAEETCLERIIDSAGRMLSMIEGVLQYSRSQDCLYAHTMVDCNDIVRSVKKNIVYVLEQKDITINCTELPTVNGNKIQILQIFQNLVSNAIKFNNNERIIIDIDFSCNGKYYEFCVSDNGIGIAKPYRKKIFDVFEQLNRREEYPGTGIGLAVCRKIIASYGGMIWVTDHKGGGSTFHFTLPIPHAEK